MIQTCLDILQKEILDSTLVNVTDSTVTISRLSIEQINQALSSTRVNSLLTTISIFLTLLTGFFTWRAKCIKDKVMQMLSRDDIMVYADKFHNMINENGTKLRAVRITPGRSNVHLVAVHRLLNDFSKLRNHISKARIKELSDAVDNAMKLIVSAEAGDKDSLGSLISCLTAIDQSLNDEVHERKSGRKSVFKSKSFVFLLLSKIRTSKTEG